MRLRVRAYDVEQKEKGRVNMFKISLSSSRIRIRVGAA